MAPYRALSEREKMVRRLGTLKNERAPFDPTYRQLAEMLAPANGRFFAELPNRNARDWSHIVDATGIEAVETSVAGIMSIASNPSQKWLGFTTGDIDLDKFQPVREWLAESRDIVLDIFDHSNTYTALPHYYRELLVFATGAGLVLPHEQNVICHYPLTCGEYYLQQNAEGEVDTLFREYHMTTAMMVRRFGLKNCSPKVQDDWRKGDLDFQHHVGHAIERRDERDPDATDEYGETRANSGNERTPGRIDKRNKPWRSVYWEIGFDRGNETLAEDGYDDFPAIAPRWDTVGGDVYGTGPGNRALPHCQRLQIMTKHHARAVHVQVRPPGQYPNSMKNREIEDQPGGRNYYDASSSQGGARQLFPDQRPQLEHMENSMLRVIGQIQQSFFANFFTPIMDDDRNERATRAEVLAVKDESLLMLGPFAQRVFRELLGPMSQTTFLQALRKNLLPPIPPDLAGRSLGVKFTSKLAQAQELSGASADERFVFHLGQVEAVKPGGGALDKFNAVEHIDRYAQKIGVDPQQIVANEQVAIIQKARAQAQAVAEQAPILESVSKSAANFAKVPQGQKQPAGAGA